MLLVPVGRLRRTDRSVATHPGPSGMTATAPSLPGLDPEEIRQIETAAAAAEIQPATPTTIPLLPGERTLARRIKFGIVQACTLSSLLLGMSAIFLAVSGADPRIGALLLLGCIAFDGLDGALARKFNVASPFGVQMDSLGDMTSFGIAAPVVVYSALSGSVAKPLLVAACALVAASAAIRLARFNVSPKDGRFFSGVPTTMGATVLSVSVLIGLSLPPVVQVVGVILIAVAMVSSFPYAKLAKVLKLPPWLLALPVLGALANPQLTFGVIVLAYLVSGPLLWLRQRRDSQPA